MCKDNKNVCPYSIDTNNAEALLDTDFDYMINGASSYVNLIKNKQ
jgi:hypothetical protein